MSRPKYDSSRGHGLEEKYVAVRRDSIAVMEGRRSTSCLIPSVAGMALDMRAATLDRGEDERAEEKKLLKQTRLRKLASARPIDRMPRSGYGQSRRSNNQRGTRLCGSG
jgi:hypothetical protein